LERSLVKIALVFLPIDRVIGKIASSILRGYYGDPTLGMHYPIVGAIVNLQHLISLLVQAATRLVR
jgi:hypothetical protein